MARHWPNSSVMRVEDASHAAQVLDFCFDTFGDFSYQHWSFEYRSPWLLIYFCELAMKTQFDLAWS